MHVLRVEGGREGGREGAPQKQEENGHLHRNRRSTPSSIRPSLPPSFLPSLPPYLVLVQLDQAALVGVRHKASDVVHHALGVGGGEQGVPKERGKEGGRGVEPEGGKGGTRERGRGGTRRQGTYRQGLVPVCERPGAVASINLCGRVYQEHPSVDSLLLPSLPPYPQILSPSRPPSLPSSLPSFLPSDPLAVDFILGV